MSAFAVPSEMIILAGGFGTRLKSVVSDVPKPMAPVVGRPFLAYLMDYWIGQGVQRFVISTGYLASVIETYFGSAYRSSKITYVHEHSPLGTGGALRLALNRASWEKELILVSNGDTWYPVNLKQLFADALEVGTPITLALKRLEKNERYGGVELSSDRKVTAFGVKAAGPVYINAGSYLLNVASTKKALSDLPESFSLESDFLVPFAASGMVGASVQNQPFLDIGIPDDYQRAEEYLK